MLNRSDLFAYRNSQYGFVIDTEKGVYVDSRTMSKAQFNKYYRTQNNQDRPDLNFRQAGEFYAFYHLGEKLLAMKSSQTNQNLVRFLHQSSAAYVQNHINQIFGRNYAIGRLAQYNNVGYVRTDVEMDKIAKYAENRLYNAISLGLIPVLRSQKNSEQLVQDITNTLRKRYMPAKAEKAPAASAQDQ